MTAGSGGPETRVTMFPVPDPEGRGAIATALFAWNRRGGLTEGWSTNSHRRPLELGLDAALPAILEVGCQIGESWSGREG